MSWYLDSQGWLVPKIDTSDIWSGVDCHHHRGKRFYNGFFVVMFANGTVLIVQPWISKNDTTCLIEFSLEFNVFWTANIFYDLVPLAVRIVSYRPAQTRGGPSRPKRRVDSGINHAIIWNALPSGWPLKVKEKNQNKNWFFSQTWPHRHPPFLYIMTQEQTNLEKKKGRSQRAMTGMIRDDGQVVTRTAKSRERTGGLVPLHYGRQWVFGQGCGPLFRLCTCVRTCCIVLYLYLTLQIQVTTDMMKYKEWWWVPVRGGWVVTAGSIQFSHLLTFLCGEESEDDIT